MTYYRDFSVSGGLDDIGDRPGYPRHEDATIGPLHRVRGVAVHHIFYPVVAPGAQNDKRHLAHASDDNDDPLESDPAYQIHQAIHPRLHQCQGRVGLNIIIIKI